MGILIMAENKLFQTWKATATYSPEYYRRLEEEKEFQRSADQFFAASEVGIGKPEPPKEDLSQKYLKQFKMETKKAEMPHPYTGTMMTTKAINEAATHQSYEKMAETSGGLPKLTTSAGGDMNVQLRLGSDVWRRQTYANEDDRKEVMKSTNRAQFDYVPEIASAVHESKHNMRKTVISEYSNAMHNKTVFTNPTFSSCLLYTSPSPRDLSTSRMPSSA
eukprot:TRINITY_DN1155_c0_g1_i1.p2 TRINITY_DN1155_c0_g1~~TRINITY_DN1155_c0_g1_i1.p2  ORF type:complete len:219 (-),score=35.38 TRINITY_DN1155_c0_g1_i1:43-699(-)